MKCMTVALGVLLTCAAFADSDSAIAQERTLKITGFGAKSGVVRVFGINSEAAMKAAAEEINKSGGVTLGDGTKAKLTVEFLDDRCNAEEGISVIRRIASTDAFVAVGSDLLQRCRIAVRHPAEEGRATPPIAGCNSRSSRMSRPRAAWRRFRNGRSATCRANSRCTSR